MLIETLLGPRYAQLLADVMTVGAALAFLYGLVKLAYQRVTGKPLPRNAITNALDVAVEVFANILGALNRAGRLKGMPSIFAPPPDARETQAPPTHRDGQSGRATVGAVAFVLAVGLCLAGLGATLAGCPKVIREPSLPPPPDGCDAGATLCHQGAPWRCGPGGHWSQADRRCDRLGAADASVVCCPSPSALRPSALVHACVPPTVCAPEVSR